MATPYTNGDVLETYILPVKTASLGQFKDKKTLGTWELPVNGASLEPLRKAAEHLRSSNIPVGFPTETVYGLGADATRSDAVKGIYKAKGRPSDNPLIIHVCDLTMLRGLISSPDQVKGHKDPIPAIYKPLIERFWPGPLTILLPKPNNCPLAPEVTAGLPTFGARMPDSALALSLIHLAGVPLAAPSANASTKPSPTTAEHVLHDLKGRIEIILDGGACQVGVESTVVDGLCDPPVVLRPGGISIDYIRECPGWEGVVRGYKDQSEIGTSAPRAPGMKYKHYSPKAKVVLYEASYGRGKPSTGLPSEPKTLLQAKSRHTPHLGLENLKWPVTIGIVSTKCWSQWAAFDVKDGFTYVTESQDLTTTNSFPIQSAELWECPTSTRNGIHPSDENSSAKIATLISIILGKDTKDIAHGLFSALRELDQRGVDMIYVEGIEDEGDIAAAVMNRLRKAASIIEK